MTRPDARRLFRPFPVGRVVATPAALAALDAAGGAAVCARLLGRHMAGDWGELDAEDRAANDRALGDGSRLLSAYMLTTGARIWIITEADRSATTVLTPEDY